jgi:D-3-phosphoglycerate dehydrogenase
MKLLGYDPYVSQDVVAPLSIKMVSLEELLRESDLVTIHVVLTKETRKVMRMPQLRLMKQTAYIVNTSRGQVFDEGALAQALNQGTIAGAALDVFDEEPTPASNPLRQVEPAKLILTPHIIGNNPGSIEAGQKMAAESIASILDGKVPETVVNPAAVERWKERFW